MTSRSTGSGWPAGTEASVSRARMCSRRSYAIRGNDSTSRATIDGASPAASSFAQAVFWPRNAKVATTRAPAFAASTAARPRPAPISSTRWPGRTVRFWQKNNEPALGGCTASGTRNTHPRQVKRWTPGSLLAKDAPEVEPERFFELSARARGGLRVLELIDVELERNALALHAVELGGQAAPLVRFREDQLRPLEGAIVLRELLHGLDDHPLDLLGLGRRNGRERGGQTHFGHQGTRYCVMSTSVESLK